MSTLMPYTSQPVAAKNITLEGFWLVQTGTYQAQYVRPLNTESPSPDTINYLNDVTRSGAHIDVANVGEVAGSVVKPSAQVESQINIPNGWTSRRFRFMMKIREESPFDPNGAQIRIFFGYTDNCDVSYSQQLDPEMRIYFNAETQITYQPYPDPNAPGGRSYFPRIVGSNQILSPLDFSDSPVQMGPGVINDGAWYMTRPEDIYHMASADLVKRSIEASQMYEGGIASNVQYETMLSPTQRQKYSHRYDVSPSRYLTNVLKGYQHAYREAEMDPVMGDMSGEFGPDTVQMYGRASRYLSNDDIGSNSFFAILRDRCGFQELGYVTWRNLCGCFPETEDNTVVSMDNGQSVRRVSMAEDSDYWRGNDDTNIAVSMLAQVVPAILMDNYMVGISFGVVNSLSPEEPFTIDIHENSVGSIVPGLNLIQPINEFKRRLVMDVLNPVTYHGGKSIQLSMVCDLRGESIIDISLDGQEFKRFVAPTFSDSLFSPMITAQQDRLDTLSNDLSYIASQVIDSGQASQQQGPSPGIITDPHGGGWNSAPNQQNGNTYDYPELL